MENSKFRCHPIMILENAGRYLLMLVFLVVLEMGELAEELVNFSGNIWEILIPVFIVLGVFVLLTGWQTVRWLRTYISIEDKAIVIERKLLMKEQNVYGIDNIANVNMEQNILERLTGTYRIKIDTDSMSTSDTTDISIVLGKEKASFFQQEIEKRREKKNADVMTEDMDIQASQKENVEYDIVYSVTDIIMHGIRTVRIFPLLFLIASIVAAVWGWEEDLFQNQTEEMAVLIVKYLGVIVTFVALLGMALRSLFGDIITYFDFRIKRLPDKLLIQYGLLKKCQYEIPIDRIHAIHIQQPLVSRILKRKYVEIVTVGVGDEENESARLMLAVKDKELYENMQLLLPEFILPDSLQLQRQRTAVLYGKLAVTAVVYAVMFAVGFFIVLMLMEVPASESVAFIMEDGLLPIVAINAAIWIIFLAGYISAHFTTGIAFSENSFIVSSGCFEKQIKVIPYRDIQTLSLHSSPWSRILGVQKSVLSILAGIMNRHVITGYYEETVFEQLIQKFYESTEVS